MIDLQVLFGAGSAINFIIDTLQWCFSNKVYRPRVSIVLTTRDYNLFQWAMASISSLAPVCESNGTFVDIKGLHRAFDDPDAYCNIGDTARTGLDDTQRSVRNISSKTKSVKTQPKRFDLYGEIYPESTVFCQGSAGLKL